MQRQCIWKKEEVFSFPVIQKKMRKSMYACDGNGICICVWYGKQPFWTENLHHCKLFLIFKHVSTFFMIFFPFLLHMRCKYSTISTNLNLWRDGLRGSIRVKVGENISRGIFILLNSEFYSFLFFRYHHTYKHIVSQSYPRIWYDVFGAERL